jgi:uncharacterized membrane protein
VSAPEAAAPGVRRRRVRHFLSWWSVIVLMLAALAATFGFGALLLGYTAVIALDPAQHFGALWHPIVAVITGVLVCGGSLWLLGYGLWILGGVVKASKTLARDRARDRTDTGAAPS